MMAAPASTVWSHVEIDSGVVRSVTITDHTGKRVVPYLAGKLTYFVDLIDTEGGRLGLWSGISYELAVAVAESSLKEFGVTEIADLTKGGRA